jgi:4-hydroxy-tetrahydrodipicolinate synthase
MTRRLSGCGTALVTPFGTHGAVDIGSLARMVNWQLDEGVDFLVPCGSTGEAATMSLEEHVRVVTQTAEIASGRVPIVAGAGSNDTHRAVVLTRELCTSGATHLLHVTPMYNKPPQRGLIDHFRTIADASPLPIILYNVPSRTGINMLAETTLALASNVTPNLMSELVARARAEKMTGAREIDNRLRPWMRAAFIESNPIPVKAALGLMDRITPTLRPPLVPLAEAHIPTVVAALVAVGALKA